MDGTCEQGAGDTLIPATGGAQCRGHPQSLLHICDGDEQHNVLYRGVPALPPASPATCFSPLGTGTALASPWALPSLWRCCQGCTRTSRAAGETTAGPQVPATPLQGLQCRRPLEVLPLWQHRQRGWLQLPMGTVVTAAPHTLLAAPLPGSVLQTPAQPLSHRQKRSFRLHCSPLVSPTHLQVPSPPMALEELRG